MKDSFSSQLITLKSVSNRFDEASKLLKSEKLNQLSKMTLHENKLLLNYFNLLLFICAYPSDEQELKIAENELQRITYFLKLKKKNDNQLFVNSGMPYTKYVSRFSHDFVQWLLLQNYGTINISAYKNASLELNDVLKLTLPSLEKSETTAGLKNDDLLETLLVKKQNQLSFIINELSKLDHIPYIKDQLYDSLGIYVTLLPLNHLFSRAYNRLPITSFFYHKELAMRFDSEALLNRKLPKATKLSAKQRADYLNIVKNTMALTNRETDPTAYPDENSFLLVNLERGISIAIYGMIPKRQLPLESYVGYTLFKNGFPAAYGGSWIFGERANFGINIFESFRGGESGYIMCQLLRLFRQVFHINYFEVEPYQYGLDNPEGIQSGAFWFYYKFGFRPLDKVLLKIAKVEQNKISKNKNYRTSIKVLESFTASNIALNLGRTVPTTVASIVLEVTKMIHKNYNDNRAEAVRDCIDKFIKKSNLKTSLNTDEKQVLIEVALWAEAMDIKNKSQLILLSQMIKTKPKDLYQYQNLLLHFFEKH